MSQTYHYTLEDFRSALMDSGLKQGDTVFCHANIGFLGLAKGVGNATELCEALVEQVFAVIGESGTFVVPTFSYSFAENKPFLLHETPSRCGTLSEYVRKHPQAQRSCDPCFSVAALGAKAASLTENVSPNSFDENSFFQRFEEAQGVFCNWNFDAGSTYIHHVERQLQVPYRFDKTFAGTITAFGHTYESTSTIWVRHRNSDETIAEFEEFHRLALQSKRFRQISVGRGTIGTITARATQELIRETLPRQPWFLTRSGRTGIIPELIPETSPKPALQPQH